jgi:hypothetical protein
LHGGKPLRDKKFPEGTNKDGEEAEVLRKIAIAGFLLGVPEFRHLSTALASTGLLQENDMRRCAGPFISRLEPEYRQQVVDDLPALLGLIKKAAVSESTGEKRFPAPAVRRQSSAPPAAIVQNTRVPNGGIKA